MINSETSLLHWNYFLALEHDLEKVSRFIEFAHPNYQVYSIELAHILLSASSEIDVIMKQICAYLSPSDDANNINDYRRIIKSNLPDLVNESIFIERYSLNCVPWENWNTETNPNWWRSYNNVKHHRDQHFQEANLQNTINAVGALLVTGIYYHKLRFSTENGAEQSIKETTHRLNPESSFVRLKPEYYYDNLVG